MDPVHPRPAMDAAGATPRLVPGRAHHPLAGPGSPEADTPGEGPEAQPGDAEYRDRLGARLRAVRRARGLRLQDVEQLSDGRFKAVVVGSYERGDRAIATHKLAMLADFYGVPVSELLPEDGWVSAPGRAIESLQLSVPALYEVDDTHDVGPLRRLVQHIQSLRGDHGLVVTLRREDLRTIAITLGVEVAELPTWLEARGLLPRR